MIKAQTKALLAKLERDHVVPGLTYALGDRHSVEVQIRGQKSLIPTVSQLRGDEWFDLASLTKVLTTTPLILHLLATNQLQLDGLVRDYLPRFNQPEVTVRHLLTHTSTLHGYIPHRNQLGADELITALYQQMKIKPGRVGKEFCYTDTGLILLGEIISQIYRKPVQQVLTEQVLAPLKLTEQLTFHPNPAKCVPTEVTPERGVVVGHVHDEKAAQLGAKCGSAGLFGTLDGLIAMARYWLGHTDLTPAGAQLVPQALRKQLYHDWTEAGLGRSLGWDLLMPNDPARKPCIWHTGFTGPFMLCDLSRGQFLVVLTNRIHPNRYNDEFLRRRWQIVTSFVNEE